MYPSHGHEQSGNTAPAGPEPVPPTASTSSSSQQPKTAAKGKGKEALKRQETSDPNANV